MRVKRAKHFCNDLSSLQSIEQTLFLSFQVAEQNIYFPLFAEQSFFSQKKNIAPQESNGRPLSYPLQK